MRLQKNERYFRRKEQDKIPVELSDMDTGNLLEKEFRWSQNLGEKNSYEQEDRKFLVIELNIKGATKIEMKNNITEMKKH